MMKMKNKVKNNKGITLISLVVTIIVLIILSTITMDAVLGDSGIFKQAEEIEAIKANERAQDDMELNRLLDAYNSAIVDNPVDTNTTVEEPIEPEMPSTWNSTKVTVMNDGTGTPIPLPNGFYYVGGNKEEGIVISDNIEDKDKGTSYETATTLKGNQFVWIPVTGEQDLKRTDFDSQGKETGSLDIKYTEPYMLGYLNESKDYTEMKEQVILYGGFYIGRYEAGDVTKGTTMRKSVTTAHEVGLRQGISPYNWVPWGKSMTNTGEVLLQSGAVYLATNMYSKSDSVTSRLCYGSQWDAMCRYIGDSQRTTTTELGLTGSNSTDMSKNIYDLSGNLYEWTMEACETKKRVQRGGCYLVSNSVSSRSSSVTPITVVEGYGFRPTLYIKK